MRKQNDIMMFAITVVILIAVFGWLERHTSTVQTQNFDTGNIAYAMELQFQSVAKAVKAVGPEHTEEAITNAYRDDYKIEDTQEHKWGDDPLSGDKKVSTVLSASYAEIGGVTVHPAGKLFQGSRLVLYKDGSAVYFTNRNPKTDACDRYTGKWEKTKKGFVLKNTKRKGKIQFKSSKTSEAMITNIAGVKAYWY